MAFSESSNFSPISLTLTVPPPVSQHLGDLRCTSAARPGSVRTPACAPAPTHLVRPSLSSRATAFLPRQPCCGQPTPARLRPLYPHGRRPDTVTSTFDHVRAPDSTAVHFGVGGGSHGPCHPLSPGQQSEFGRILPARACGSPRQSPTRRAHTRVCGDASRETHLARVARNHCYKTRFAYTRPLRVIWHDRRRWRYCKGGKGLPSNQFQNSHTIIRGFAVDHYCLALVRWINSGGCCVASRDLVEVRHLSAPPGHAAHASEVLGCNSAALAEPESVDGWPMAITVQRQ